MNMNMSLFSVITGPVGKILSLILLMSVFGLALGTMNSWFLQTQDAGVVNNERFDRVAVKGSHTSADDAWEAVTAIASTNPADVAGTGEGQFTENSGYKLEVSGSNCKVGEIPAVDASVSSSTPAVTVNIPAYTPSGTLVTISGAAAATATKRVAVDVTISGCEWSPESKLFKQAGMAQLIEIVLQAVGLAGPVFLLTEVGMFARAFTNRMGGGPVLSIILTLIVLLLVGTLMNTFVPFLSDAFSAIDSKRFLMYDTGLGKLATVISSFLGVMLVAGLLMLGWSLWQNLRSGNLLSGATGSRM